ncbi:GntR family transcriptional regulator [Rhizobium rhizogenes]|uniref:GntR family transcriptional regulator n=1 Tax=Rhizobium rhizogenes TaxID=359 RepID=UPI0015D4CC6D|nr:GntR family transcriptional regulator [Rhizobium rhizogenes]
MAEVRVFQRKTLHSEIVDHLRDLIVDGKLEPGEKISERDLCALFDISRTPLREALKALAAEGMVELLPQRGARVVMITDEELHELFPIIASLEALAGELACDAIRPDELVRIETMHADMMSAYRQAERLEYSRLNRAIHFAIFEATRNGSLLALYQNLELKIRNIRHTVRQRPQDWKQAVQDHEEIISALSAREKPRLSQVMRRHVMNTAEMVRHSVHDIGDAGGSDDNATTAD